MIVHAVRALVLLLLAAVPAAAQGTVTFLHFNDVYEITPVEGGAAGGLARVATLRARLRAQQPALVTTLGGDFLSPSAIGTAVVNGERLAGRQMVAVLNLVGLDWAAFGNHEFDISEAALRARLAEARFRIVASNVTDAQGALFPNTVKQAVLPIRTANGVVRTCLIGLTIDSNQQPWVRYLPFVDTARSVVAGLKGQCDVIVALTHLELEQDQQLAEQVPEIDLILGGHEHENWLMRRGPRLTPVVKADANVRTVAVVTVRVPRRGARPIVSSRLEAIDASIPAGPRTNAEVRKWTDAAFNGFRAAGFEPSQVVATLTEPLDGRESAVRNRHTPLTGLIVEAMRREAGTDVAMFNGGSIRIDDVLPRGPVSQYDVIRVLPFGGPIVKATFTGALLSQVLDVGEKNAGTGGYLHTARPQTIDPAARYDVAISDFLLTGAEANLGFLTRQNPGVTNVSELRDVRMAVIDELRRRYP
ncbi:MAG: bifunctional metallophosphatase/5'-nucleotidase [Acidimicrobiia bacterium]|nr:bifunctional metallophosphatase/5'-nucleotidase [Acidimicrobiia bacterium]